jgi:hypothetical protein
MFTSRILRAKYVSGAIVKSENMKLNISLHPHYCSSHLTSFSPQKIDFVQHWVHEQDMELQFVAKMLLFISKYGQFKCFSAKIR